MRIGVIGLGYWGPNLVRNLLALGHRVHVYDRDRERVEAAAVRFPEVVAATSLAAILDDPELAAVAIAVPLTQHAPLIVQALDAGKHVFVEKPLCATLAEADAIGARLGGRVLAVGHITQYSPGLRAFRDSIQRGAIGRLCCLDLVRTHLGPIYPGSDVLTEVAAHDVAILLSLRSEPLARVHAWGAARLDLGRADSACLLVEWSEGVFARVAAGWASARRQRQATAEGTRGTLAFEVVDGRERLELHHQAEALAQLREGRGPQAAREVTRVEAPDLPSAEPLAEELRAFVACVETGARPEVDLGFARRVVAVLEAARRSMERGGKGEPVS